MVAVAPASTWIIIMIIIITVLHTKVKTVIAPVQPNKVVLQWSYRE